MGTRSTLRVKETKKSKNNLVCIYRQMDGYFSGMGKDILDYFGDIKICNGIGSEQSSGKWANGMGCFAAQVVEKLKADHGLGGIYLIPTFDPEEYNYILYGEEESEIVYLIADDGDKVWYDGPLSEFNPDMKYEDIVVTERYKKLKMVK